MHKKRKGLGKFLPDDFDYYVHNGSEAANVSFTWCPYHKKFIIIKSSEEGFGGSDYETPFCLFCGSHLHQGGEKSHGIPTKKSLEVVGWFDTDMRSKTLKLVLTQSFIGAAEDLQEALETLNISSLFKRLAVIQVQLPSHRKRKRLNLKGYGSTGIVLRNIIISKYSNVEKSLRKNLGEKSSKPKPIYPSKAILSFSQRDMNDLSVFEKMSLQSSTEKTENAFTSWSEKTSKNSTTSTLTPYYQSEKLRSQKNISNLSQTKNTTDEKPYLTTRSARAKGLRLVMVLRPDDPSSSLCLKLSMETTPEERSRLTLRFLKESRLEASRRR